MSGHNDVVQARYAQAAIQARNGAASCGCGSAAVCCADPITSNLYDDEQASSVPAELSRPLAFGARAPGDALACSANTPTERTPPA